MGSYVEIIIVCILVGAALWAVMTRSMLRSAIALALASAFVAVLMFKLHSPLAAVFELSVCSGLISVLFISTISLTQAETREEKEEHRKARLKRFWLLPVVVAVIAVVLVVLALRPQQCLLPPVSGDGVDPRTIMWRSRPFDMLGQVIILLAGVFGVVILFKEPDKQ